MWSLCISHSDVLFAPIFSLQDCCLIPEVPFFLEGKDGLMDFIEKKLRENGHAVLVVAEGAGQELIAKSVGEMNGQDASGNRLLLDVGLWLSQKIKVGLESNFTPCFSFVFSV